MAERTQYPPNTFCWTELMTSDTDGAKAFYQDIFGWNLIENPIGPGQVYIMAQLKEKNVAAMYKMNEAQRRQHIPPNWLSYISVSDVDGVVAKARELGAAVTVEPMDVFNVGRMAVLTDPQGAVFALWQPKEHIGAERVNEPGTLCWNELYTRDVDGSGSFYTAVFGWDSQTAEMAHGTYTSFMNGERPAGGMLEIQKEWGDVPPHWMVYFAVDDCDATVKKAESLGGKVINPPADVPGVGRFAIATDPQGAAFSVIALENPQD